MGRSEMGQNGSHNVGSGKEGWGTVTGRSPRRIDCDSVFFPQPVRKGSQVAPALELAQERVLPVPSVEARAPPHTGTVGTARW